MISQKWFKKMRIQNEIKKCLSLIERHLVGGLGGS